MHALDRDLINSLQRGIDVCERPFADLAARIGLSEEALLARVQKLLDDGVLTRFGPLFQAERLGGAFTLCAMQVAETDFERIAGQVNAFPEVAHNYRREHALNMWFVLATEQPGDIARLIARIEALTGCRVYDMPKLDEYYVGLHLEA